jgi:hypothetical protein
VRHQGAEASPGAARAQPGPALAGAATTLGRSGASEVARRGGML